MTLCWMAQIAKLCSSSTMMAAHAYSTSSRQIFMRQHQKMQQLLAACCYLVSLETRGSGETHIWICRICLKKSYHPFACKNQRDSWGLHRFSRCSGGTGTGLAAFASGSSIWTHSICDAVYFRKPGSLGNCQTSIGFWLHCSIA